LRLCFIKQTVFFKKFFHICSMHSTFWFRYVVLKKRSKNINAGKTPKNKHHFQYYFFFFGGGNEKSNF
jgi:hypothetical protein